jgi:gluconate 2-dehydrogenase gamma chain
MTAGERDWISAEELGTDVLVEAPGDPRREGPAETPLDDWELCLLEAIAARIFPTTDTPGAVEAGAVHYVNQALAEAYGSSVTRYHEGLRALDEHCRAGLGGDFVALGDEAQDAVLRSMQQGALPEVDEGGEFFALLRRHILEGVFCEPRYGGNRDLIGWQLVGFPGQRYGYQDAYINRVIDLQPVAAEGVPTEEA